ncbi:MAG: O-antigen ligase family protein, partial [Solirubrobacterales bacterium]
MTISRLRPRQNRLASWLLVAGSSSLLTYYALHHGSYSVIDRQQMAALVWAGIGVAAIVGLLPRVRPVRAVWLPFLALAALGLWTAIGIGWTESAERSFAEVARIAGYLGVLALVWLAVGRDNWRLVAAGLLSAGVLICSLAVLSRFWPSLFPVDTVAKNLGARRLSYPFGYWNAIGCWAAMSTTMCLAWAAHARSGIVRALALAAVPVCVLALYFTVSRAALGGVVLGPAVVMALGGHRWLTLGLTAVAGVAGGAVVMVAREHQQLVLGISSQGAESVLPILVLASAACAAIAYAAHRLGLGDRLRMGPRAARRGLLAGGVIALLIAVVVLPPVARDAWDQFSDGNSARPVAANPDARLVNLSGNRVNVWRSAWRAAKARPAKGIGSGTFEFWWNRDGDNGEFLKDAHSIYLENLLELGVPGLLLLFAFLGGLAFAGIRGRAGLRSRGAIGVHAGLLGVFAVFLLQAGVDWIWESTAVMVLVLASAAVAASAGAAPHRRG